MGKTLGYGEITVANMTEPFTVMLTNEAQQFATDSNRKVTSAQSYYTDIIVIRGSQERTDYTIGNITSGSGITVSKTNERVTFSVSVGATIGADTGVIEIPITLDGQTVKKQFSWSCGKQGPQGVKGENGSKGKSVQNVIEYYLATSASSDVTSSTNGWSTDPTTQKLTAEKKYLWNCKQTVYDDGTKGSITSPVICGTYGDKGIDGKNATYITVSGTNFDTVAGISKMASYISINGTKYDFMPTRGHTLVIINPSNGAVENIKSYDTYTTTSLLDTPLSEVESDKIICLFTADASGLTQTSRNTLNECGSNLSDIWTQARKTHVFIGMKGLQKGQAYEIVASGSNATKTVTAYYTNSGIVTNGANGQDGISPKVSLSKTGDTTTISIVDATGTHTQTVKDGTNGTPGAAGKDGKTSYFHVKYSNDGGKTFTGNSGEDTGIYMGSYTDYTEADSTDVKKYTWVKVKGDIGQKGDNAKNLSITPSSQYFKSTDGGKTFAPNTITIKPTIQGEISFGKWQYSIDGGVSFADVVNGQKGLTISNNVLTVSRDSSLYSDAVTMVTFRAVASDSSFYDTCSIAKIYDVSDIGDGRNLWITRDNITLQACEKDKYIYTTTGTSAVCIGADGSSVGTNTIALQTGTKYTISFVISSPSEVGNALWYFCTALNSTGVKNYGGYGVKLVTGENIVSQTITVDTSCDAAGLVIYNLPTDCIIKDIQVEKGSSPTGWTPAPEDVQTAILSTKSEISDVSLKVDKNKQAIEQRVEKTTYQQDLNLVKGDISKANEGLNKWRYEIYPKSLFTSEYQGKSTMDVFAKNTNLTPSQSVLINDTDFGKNWAYGDNYIGYALTFVKFSAAKSVAITFKHDDGAHLYLNGKLIGGDDTCNTGSGESLTLSFIQGWNCLEVVLNEKSGGEYIGLGTTISAISECQLMNCYYGTPVARQSHITNQLVENTTNIEGVTTTMQKVMTTVGGSDRIDEFVNNYNKTIESEKQFKKTIGETYTTKDEFNGLEIGGRNLILNSAFKKGRKEWSDWGNPTTREIVSSNGKSWAHIVGNKQNYQGFNQWTPAGSIKEGDHITFSARIKGSAANQRFTVGIHWINSGNTIISQDWHTFIVDATENVYTWTVDAKESGCDKLNLMVGVSDTSAAYNVYFTEIMVVKGNKATDWTPAPEDNEINGQNLVSNLPSNWEQGSFDGSRVDVGGTYSTGKVDNSTIIRVKELVPVSGSITISNAYSNQSKKPIQHYIVAFDVDKKYLGSSYVSTAWNDFPRIVDMKDAKYIAVIVRYKDESAITPSDISQICLKIERGTSATPFTLAPEDVNGKIVNVETIANQTAKKFEWIVKGGDSSSNFTLTDRVADLVAERINFNGLVTFSGLAKSTQDKINSPTSGNLITVSPTNPTSNYANTTFSIVSDDVGGRCIQTTAQFVPFTNYASNIFKPGEQIYYNINVPNWSSTTFDANLGIWFFTAEKKCVANSCTRVTLQRTTWNRLSGYITVPTSGWSGIIYYVIGIENPNKYQLGLVSNSYIEKTTSYATTYASSAVNWVTNNGSSTTSLNSMVKKWTDGAVSDTTQINGGWIKANTITASKIAVGDFTNYADINESNTYGFSVEKTTDGVWFSKDGSKLTRDNYISKMYSCEPGQTFYVEYDISNTIKDSTEYKAAGIMLFGCDGTQTVKWYQRRGAVVGTAAGTVTHMSQQLTMPSGTRFFYVVLQIEGFQPFTGTLKIRNLSVRKAVTGAVIVDGSITADKIATDAIKSRNYISSGGTQGSFLNLSDGSFTSPNLSWDSNGNLIAKNANLSGQITATNGSIGGWNIGDTSLFTGITKSNVRIYDAVNADNAQNMYQKEQHSLILANTYINSFNSSLNSSDNYWHAQGVTINDGEFQVGETLYNPNLVNSDKDEVYYDRGLTRVFGGYITMSRDCSINSDSRSLYADIILNGEELYICTNRNILFSPLRTSIFTTEDPSKYNAIETTGDAIIGGNMVLRDRSNGNHKVAIYPYDGCIEMYGKAPYIDFHYGSTTSDYTSRIIAQSGWDCLTFTGSILLGGDIYNSSNGHYTWDGKTDAYLGCGNYSGGNNIYYYANYHAFYVNNDLGSGMMYINTNGVTSRVGFTKTSDERIKKNFESFDDNIIDAYMNIEPVKYQLKQSSNDNYHFGFKAQHVDKVFSDYGDTYNESFDICTSRPIDPDKAKELYGVDDMTEEYGLRYDELIAPTTYMVQHTYKELESTKNELEQVKQEKADLETRLQAIEAKLGL